MENVKLLKDVYINHDCSTKLFVEWNHLEDYQRDAIVRLHAKFFTYLEKSKHIEDNVRINLSKVIKPIVEITQHEGIVYFKLNEQDADHLKKLMLG